MKDYYRILQVHPEAEKEVITAAYRRLIRKYHPDTLNSEDRDNPEISQIVRDLNEAYEVLGNEEKRLQYDEECKWDKKYNTSEFAIEAKIEKRLYLIRCGKTQRTFTMHMARPEGSNTPFSVLGFEPLEAVPELAQLEVKRKSIWHQIISVVSKETMTAKDSLTESNSKPASLSGNEIEKLFTESVTLTMGEIDWNGHACPDCGSMVENANGTLATWSGCSKCGHIKCVGSVSKTRRGNYSLCPWCGKKNKITRSVPVGKKDHLSLKGKMKTSKFVHTPDDSRILESERSHELKDGKR